MFGFWKEQAKRASGELQKTMTELDEVKGQRDDALAKLREMKVVIETGGASYDELMVKTIAETEKVEARAAEKDAEANKVRDEADSLAREAYRLRRAIKTLQG